MKKGSIKPVFHLFPDPFTAYSTLEIQKIIDPDVLKFTVSANLDHLDCWYLYLWLMTQLPVQDFCFPHCPMKAASFEGPKYSY